MKRIDPVGQLDIARRLGYPRATVVQWIQRAKEANSKPTWTVFDVKPQWTVSDAPVWNWPDVYKWAVKNNRTDRMSK